MALHRGDDINKKTLHLFYLKLNSVLIIQWFYISAKLGSRFEVQGSRFKVQGSRFKVRGVRFEVRGVRFGQRATGDGRRVAGNHRVLIVL